MKAGAMDFITKPFSDHDLLEALDRAIKLDAERRKVDAERDRIQSLLDTLSPREQEVMFAVVSGLMNKQVAYRSALAK